MKIAGGKKHFFKNNITPADLDQKQEPMESMESMDQVAVLNLEDNVNYIDSDRYSGSAA